MYIATRSRDNCGLIGLSLMQRNLDKHASTLVHQKRSGNAACVGSSMATEASIRLPAQRRRHILNRAAVDLQEHLVDKVRLLYLIARVVHRQRIVGAGRHCSLTRPTLCELPTTREHGDRVVARHGEARVSLCISLLLMLAVCPHVEGCSAPK
jgi:hypothetical protein